MVKIVGSRRPLRQGVHMNSALGVWDEPAPGARGVLHNGS
jgi:hypothetical protein